MSHYTPDVQPLLITVNDGGNAIAIAANVENRKTVHVIYGGKRLPENLNRRCSHLGRLAEPVLEHGLGFGVNRPEVPDGLFGNDSHRLMYRLLNTLHLRTCGSRCGGEREIAASEGGIFVGESTVLVFKSVPPRDARVSLL